MTREMWTFALVAVAATLLFLDGSYSHNNCSQPHNSLLFVGSDGVSIGRIGDESIGRMAATDTPTEFQDQTGSGEDYCTIEIAGERH